MSETFKYPDTTRPLTLSVDVHRHVVQKRHEIAFLASRVRIENALLKGEHRVEVTGDQTFPAVVADVLAFYRNDGWSNELGDVGFDISPDGLKGVYTFESASAAYTYRQPLVARSVAARMHDVDADDETSIGQVRGVGAVVAHDDGDEE